MGKSFQNHHNVTGGRNQAQNNDFNVPHPYKVGRIFPIFTPSLITQLYLITWKRQLNLLLKAKA